MTHAGHVTRTVQVEGLARVDGAGSLRVQIHDGRVTDVALEIFEPPRFFEALLVGRHCLEAPDITARICGICPVAYQLSACAAMEDACNAEVDERVTTLRRLLYCGEWIQSHALHIHLLHAPDFLGCQDAVQLAEIDRSSVQRGLEIKRTGNLVMTTVGGRAIHPVNVRVGGFYSTPSRQSIAGLIEPLRRARAAALETVSWVAGFYFPDVEREYRLVALRDEQRYAIERGRPRTSDGDEMNVASFADQVVEEHVARSTALHARLDGRHYLTGPLARFAMNRDLLTPLAREAADGAGLGPVCTNPFQSVIVRAVELVDVCDEALAIAEGYEPPVAPAVEVTARRAVGTGATEAPRGLLIHRYEIDDDGIIVAARLITDGKDQDGSGHRLHRSILEKQIMGASPHKITVLNSGLTTENTVR